MGKPVVGEVVVLPLPQTNLQVGKRRPALVVADLAGDDLILCQITTQARQDNYSIALTSTEVFRSFVVVKFNSFRCAKPSTPTSAIIMIDAMDLIIGTSQVNLLGTDLGPGNSGPSTGARC